MLIYMYSTFCFFFFLYTDYVLSLFMTLHFITNDNFVINFQ